MYFSCKKWRKIDTKRSSTTTSASAIRNSTLIDSLSYSRYYNNRIGIILQKDTASPNLYRYTTNIAHSQHQRFTNGAANSRYGLRAQLWHTQ